MPAQWTGRLIGELHNEGITAKELAAEAGLHEKYLSHILNGHAEPKNAEEKLFEALERLKKRKKED